MEFTIYLVTNKINDKKYVGVTKKKLYVRKSQHLHFALKRNKEYRFYEAIREHGKDSFVWETLEIVEDGDLAFSKEREWIQKYRSNLVSKGYNSTCGGIYYEHSEETKKKISETVKKAMQREEVQEKLKKANSGENNNQYGRKWTKEEKEVLSKKRGGKSFEVLKKNSLEKIAVYQNINQCAEDLNLPSANICKCLKGYKHYNSSKGYVFRYLSD